MSGAGVCGGGDVSVAVVCVGMACLDVVQRVESPPEWGRKSVSSSMELAAGGPAANAAVTAAALLGGATLVTALGRSTQADLVRADLRAHGVDVIDIAPPGFEVHAATCLVDAAGERTVVAPGAPGSTAVLDGPARAALAGAAGVLVDGHHPRAGEAALRERPPGCVAVLDAGSAKPHVEPWLRWVDVVAGSADYARGLGLDLDGAVRHALDRGAGAAVMTDGAAALRFAAADAPLREVIPPQVRARDTLGAGDAFHGALLAAVASGRRLEVAVEVAARVAATRVAHRGARGWLAGVTRLG